MGRKVRQVGVMPAQDVTFAIYGRRHQVEENIQMKRKDMEENK